MIGPLLIALAVAAPARGFSVGPVPSWVESVPVELDAEPPAEGVSDGLHYLLSDVQTRLGPPQETFAHYARAIVNRAGLEGASQVSIGFDPSYGSLSLHFVRLWRRGTSLDRLQPTKIRVLQRETELESQLYDGRLSVVLFVEDLRVGDVLEYAYTLKGQNPVFEDRYSGSFDVEWSAPLRRMRWRLLCPPDRRLVVRSHGTSLAPTVRETSVGREYLLETWDTPAIPGEKKIPTWHDHWGSVQISEWESWEEVVRWGQRLFEVRGTLPPDLAERVLRWKEMEPSAAVLAALRFVQDEVRYLGIELGVGSHQPAPPGVVFERRFGDCKDKVLLFLAIVRALGLKADPVLVHSSLGRALDDWLPTPFAFDHAVARVEVGGRVHWVDPTASAQGGKLAQVVFADYVRALILETGGAQLTPIPVRRPPSPTRTVRDRFVVSDPKGPVAFTVESRYEAGDADWMRADLQRRSRDEIGRSYLDFYAKSYPSIRSAGPLVVSDDRETNLITVREHYSVPEFFRPIDGSQDRRRANVEPVTLLDHLQKPGPKRTAPLAVGHPVFLRHVIEVSVPPNWSFEPESATVFDEALRFRFESRYEPGTLVLDYEYQTLTDAVPAARLADHLETLDAVWTWTSYSLTDRPPLRIRSGVDWAIVTTAGLLVALSLVAAVGVHRFRAGAGRVSPPGLQKLGAGLLVVVGALLLVTALATVRVARGWPDYGGLAWTERTVPGSRFYHPAWPALRLAELGGHAVFMIGVGLLWVLLFQRRRRFRWAFLAFSLGLCVFVYAEAAALAWLPGGGPAVLRRAIGDALLSLGPLFAAGPYVLTSRRVRETLTG